MISESNVYSGADTSPMKFEVMKVFLESLLGYLHLNVYYCGSTNVALQVSSLVASDMMIDAMHGLCRRDCDTCGYKKIDETDIN